MRKQNNIFADIISVFKNEIKLILNDIDLIIILLLSPIFYAFFYSSIYINKSQTKAPIAVVDYDKSDHSRTFIQMLAAHPNIYVKAIDQDKVFVNSLFLENQVYGILVIPHDFSKNLASKKQAKIELTLNNTRFLISNDINRAINELAYNMTLEQRKKFFYENGFNVRQADICLEPISLEIINNYNKFDSYGDFLIPGILLLILQQTLLIGISESVAKQREENSLLESLNKTENAIGYIMGKIFPYAILYLFYAYIFLFLISKLISINDSFDINFYSVAILTIIFIFSIALLGMFIGSFFKRKILALQFFVLTSYPFFLISGYSWPYESLPLILKAFSLLLPSTAYFNGINKAIYMNANIFEIFSEAMTLSLIAFALLSANYFRFNQLKEAKESKPY